MSFNPDKAIELLRRGLRHASRHPRVRAVLRHPRTQEAWRRTNQARYDAGKQVDRLKRWQRDVHIKGEHRINEWRRTGDFKELFKRERGDEGDGGEVGEERASSSPHPSQQVARVAFVVTRATREALKAQGFSKEAIRELRPAEALALVEKEVQSGPEAEEFLLVFREEKEGEGGELEEDVGSDDGEGLRAGGRDKGGDEEKEGGQTPPLHHPPQRREEDDGSGGLSSENEYHQQENENRVVVVEEQERKAEEERPPRVVKEGSSSATSSSTSRGR